MKTRRMRNATKRGLVYLSVILLYVVVFTNILLTDRAVDHLQSSVTTGHTPG